MRGFWGPGVCVCFTRLGILGILFAVAFRAHKANVSKALAPERRRVVCALLSYFMPGPVATEGV